MKILWEKAGYFFDGYENEGIIRVIREGNISVKIFNKKNEKLSLPFYSNELQKIEDPKCEEITTSKATYVGLSNYKSNPPHEGNKNKMKFIIKREKECKEDKEVELFLMEDGDEIDLMVKDKNGDKYWIMTFRDGKFYRNENIPDDIGIEVDKDGCIKEEE